MSEQLDTTSNGEQAEPGRRLAVVSALLIVAIYATVGAAWMIWGGWILLHVLQVPAAGNGENVQAIKEWAFIAGSAVGLLFILAWYVQSIVRTRETLEGRLEGIGRNYQKIFDRNPLPMWVYEPATMRILAVNAAATEKYGYTAEEFRELKITDLVALKQLPRALKVVGERCEGPRTTGGWTHRRKDGSTFEVEALSDTMEYDGKAARVVIVTDVTQQKATERTLTEQQDALKESVAARAEELTAANEKLKREIEGRRRIEAELVQARDEAEATSETKSGFIANTSHEIRTPLTSILGYADLLADPDLSAEARAKYVAVLQQNASHLLRMIDDLLDLSRMEMGRMAVTFDQYPPRELAERAIDLIKPRAAEKSLELRLEMQEDIPESVRTDSARVVQILINLLMNAVKFTPAGRVTMRVQADAHKGRLWFEVTDTGIGMEKKDMERIFEPFYQVEHGSNRRYGGAGLGLAISKELAGLLGGEIEVSSAAGKGSTFRLGLPTANLKGEKLEAAKGSKGENGLTGHILLADDNAVVRWLVEEYLRRAGAIVTGVGDGKSAVDAVEASLKGGEKIDLVLMDINMPGMDGLAAMKKIRELGFAGPVAALTAHSVAVPAQEWMQSGWSAVASKPIDRNQFIPLVGRLIEEGRAKG